LQPASGIPETRASAAAAARIDEEVWRRIHHPDCGPTGLAVASGLAASPGV
jgi:hypothetical protein